jgi:phosphoglucomutase
MIDHASAQRIQTWLSGPYDDATKQAIKDLQTSGNDAELQDAFYRTLEFGTGGLRGTMGVGTNRMNVYTVGAATQGLANYLHKAFTGQAISMVIGHDSRNNSRLFAETVANVLSANDIKVYLFAELRPTPEVSFMIRQLGAQGGVMVTASHNPKEYNGYKAYWSDGGQLIPPHDKNVITEVEAISDISEVKFTPKPGNIVSLGADADDAYLSYIQSLSISKEAIARQKDLKIVYSSIHGTGITLVPQVLQRFGFTNVHVVQAQATPDGNFPTVVYPNPEEQEAMTMALNLAKELDADLIIATDPDADRVGMGLKGQDGRYQLLNGNQTATLLFYYMLEAWKNAGKITGHEMIVKTIVTSDILNKMAPDYNVKCYNTLTGFKYIAGVIAEKEGKEQFICGGEESYGYLVGDAVRDKDAIASCAMIAEMVAYAKDKGLSLFDFLIEIYKKYNYYKEGLVSITKKGQSGAEEIKKMMADLRVNPPKSIAGSPTVHMLDYQSSVATEIATGATSALAFDKSNVLQFITADGTKVSARPSGTEPKIKFYVSVNEPLADAAAFVATGLKLDAKIKAIQQELNLN